MNRQDISKKQFMIYMAATFILAYLIQIIASNFASSGNRMAFQMNMAGCMFMPFVGVLVARIPLKGMGWVPHLKGKVKYLFFALWAPAVLMTIGAGIYFLIFLNTFDSEFLTLRAVAEEAGALEQMEAAGITVPMYALISTIQALTFVPFINMFVALGEEVGWRGAMYPYLKNQLGKTKGRIVGGFIWGAWHWPVMILAGYEYGMDYIGAPVLGLIVFCIFTIALGILHDYVYDKTKTIWMPALLHGATNAFTLFAYMQKPEFANRSILGPACNGIISMIPFVVAAIIICKKQSSSN